MKFSTDGVGSTHKVSSNPINMSSPIKEQEEQIIFPVENSGVNSVQLDDFFQFLDSKTVQKIMETTPESRARILSDVAQMEYDTNGAQAILNSLG